MIIGKWSDNKSVDAAYLQRDPVPNVARNTSGGLGWVSILYGEQMGVLGPFSNV